MAIALLSLYAVGTRLLPDRLGEFGPIAGYRLTGTIGYWNGLGIFVVIGLFLALGFAARGERLATRAFAGAALPVLATTMYFTFSRGAWLALLVGFVAAFVVDARRLQLAFASAVLGVLPAVGILLASFAPGRARQPRISCRYSLSSRRSRRLLLRCSGWPNGVSACPRPSGSLGRRRWSSRFSSASGQRGCGRARRCMSRSVRGTRRTPLRSPRAPTDGSSTCRRTAASVSGRQPGRHSPSTRIVGVGGGTYWQEWVANPRGFFASTEAHGVYQETLAELGIIGLVPAALRPRAAGGGCGAREALAARAVRVRSLCRLGRARGCRLGLGADGRERRRAGLRRGPHRGRARTIRVALAPAARGGALAIAVLLTLLSTTSVLASARLDAARAALRRGDLAAAATHARSARRFAPWSTQALEVTAVVRLDQGRPAEAREAYRAIVRRDSRSWIAWAHLADVTTGAERAHAVDVARSLNPHFELGPNE